MSPVQTSGVRAYEISIEVSLNRLRALGLTLDDIANAIRRGSLDLSAGTIDTVDSQVRVRTLGQRYDQYDFEEIVVLGRSAGTAVRLGDIAEVRDEFQNADLLLKNGGLGLLLVFFALALFLEIRLAVWVTVGLVVSFVGVLTVMLALDIAINTLSLFVFALAIGIIVDDAIVVAEHVHLERKKGTPGVVAAIRGTRRNLRQL